MNFKSLSKRFTPTPKIILASVIFVLRYGKDKINFVGESLSLDSVGRKKSRTSLVWGFTLIELLVVIAIIGILSGIVLTSLNSARDKARDARIKSSVKNMRTVLELGFDGSKYISLGSDTGAIGNPLLGKIYWSPNQDYARQLDNLVKDVIKQGGAITFMVNNVGPGGYNVKSFAIYGQLASDSGKYFCIDSTGKVKEKAGTRNTSSCPD